MYEYKEKVKKLKKQYPETFEIKKDLSSIKTAEEVSPSYWKELKGRYQHFSVEDEYVEKLLLAAVKDWNLKKVKK